MSILETERLSLREISSEDTAFICELYNEPSFHKYIGDKGITDDKAAADYIQVNFIKSYIDNGFGLWLVEIKDDRIPIGICGLVKRETLDHPDIGFAFLTKHEKNGFGFESAKAALEYGRDKLKIPKVLAITTQDNAPSGRLLQKMGLLFEDNIESPSGQILKRYSITF